MPEVKPRYTDTRLGEIIRQAAHDMAVTLPEGLALLYWDFEGSCRAFSLHEHNLHFQVPKLHGVYKHTSEIVAV